tara:strand:- start:1605 stop:1970 length:366 start_codon:yes stop_codon:yes gene_type:complete
MEEVILDTSFILTALKFKIDIKAELNRILDEKFSTLYIDKTLNELEGKPLKNLAKNILDTINAEPIKTTEEKNVDSLIIAHSKANPGAIVATQDKALKEKLKKRNTRLITIRQKRYLKLLN